MLVPYVILYMDGGAVDVYIYFYIYIYIEREREIGLIDCGMGYFSFDDTIRPTVEAEEAEKVIPTQCPTDDVR